jgi:hypothetical protein
LDLRDVEEVEKVGAADSRLENRRVDKVADDDDDDDDESECLEDGLS